MKKAFTLIELLVVISIIAVLVTILVPVVMAGLGKSETTVCQNNLGVIGRKHNDYANGSENYANPFPRHIDSGNPHDTAPITGLVTAETLDAAIGTCGMQTVWVMIERGDLTDTAFRCPADADWTSRASADKYGWEALTEFSYGIHYPYADDGGAPTANLADPNAREQNSAARLVYRENMVLFADRNPGGAVDGTTVSHTNHASSDGGCIIVSRIGNTKFFKASDKSTAGFGDDIYVDADEAASPGSGDGIPDSGSDTVITPETSR